MVQNHFQVVRVHAGLFRRPSEQILRVLHHILIDRRRGRNHHRERSRIPTSGAARTLPQRRDGSGIACHDYGIERAHINAQFQRIGGNHSADISRPQALLNLAALPGQIACAVAAHGIRRQPAVVAGVFQIGHQQFRREAVVGKHQGLLAVIDEFHGHAPGLIDITAADAQLAVHYRRVVPHENLLARGRAIAIHKFKRGFGQGLSQFAGIGDGG